MLIRPAPPQQRPGSAAFTAVELLVACAILVILSAMSFPSILGFYEDQKLRQASVELQTFLISARALAQRNRGTCAVSFSSTNVVSASGNNICGPQGSDSSFTNSTALPNLNLNALTNVRGLCLSNVRSRNALGACTAPSGFSFSALGVLSGTSQIIYLFGTGTNSQYCLSVGLTVIRRGSSSSRSSSCNYLSS